MFNKFYISITIGLPKNMKIIFNIIFIDFINDLNIFEKSFMFTNNFLLNFNIHIDDKL